MFHKSRKAADRLVNNDRTQEILIALIMINGMTLGISTFDIVTENPDMEARFDKIDLAFLFVFTAELCLQFLASGIRMFRDPWNVFDFMLIFYLGLVR